MVEFLTVGHNEFVVSRSSERVSFATGRVVKAGHEDSASIKFLKFSHVSIENGLYFL